MTRPIHLVIAIVWSLSDTRSLPSYYEISLHRRDDRGFAVTTNAALFWW